MIAFVVVNTQKKVCGGEYCRGEKGKMNMDKPQMRQQQKDEWNFRTIVCDCNCSH